MLSTIFCQKSDLMSQTLTQFNTREKYNSRERERERERERPTKVGGIYVQNSLQQITQL